MSRMFRVPISRNLYEIPFPRHVESQADLDAVTELLWNQDIDLSRGTIVVCNDEDLFLWDGERLVTNHIKDRSDIKVTLVPIETDEPINLCTSAWSNVWLPNDEQRQAVASAPEVQVRAPSQRASGIYYREVFSDGNMFRFYYEDQPDIMCAIFHFNDEEWLSQDEEVLVEADGVILCSIGRELVSDFKYGNP